MKTSTIFFALACLTLCGCLAHKTPREDFIAVTAEPNVIKVLILGSVKFPGMHNQKTGDSLARIPLGTPLHEVISVGAGGFQEMSDKKRVRIHRLNPGSDGKRERIVLDFTQADERKVENVLRDGDTIYVPEAWPSDTGFTPTPLKQH